MSMTWGMRLAIVALGLSAVGCASSPPPPSQGQRFELGAGHPLAGVTSGMNDIQVRNVAGEPQNSRSYQTGKQWIPFYFGPDTHRTEWIYDGKGQVVFSRNRYSGGLSVINVIAQ